MKLSLGNILPHRYNPQQVYLLHITCRYDNENTTTRSHKYAEKDQELLLKTIEFCDCIMNKDMSNAKIVSNVAAKAVQTVNLPHTGNEMLLDLIPYDTTYPGMFATMIEYKVTYFDENGIEHIMNILK
jgi:hypothetical protein